MMLSIREIIEELDIIDVLLKSNPNIIRQIKWEILTASEFISIFTLRISCLI